MCDEKKINSHSLTADRRHQGGGNTSVWTMLRPREKKGLSIRGEGT